MDDLYRDYILEHYRRPHNFGVLDNATASYEGANPLCGDRITLQLRLAGDRVVGVGFTGRGCAISQASASLLTDEIKGKPVADAAAMTSQDVLDMLGIEISPARLKCALLSLDTLQHALAEAEPPADSAIAADAGATSSAATTGGGETATAATSGGATVAPSSTPPAAS
jgi:nitrogen fixation NifU-like protein